MQVDESITGGGGISGSVQYRIIVLLIRNKVNMLLIQSNLVLPRSSLARMHELCRNLGKEVEFNHVACLLESGSLVHDENAESVDLR